MLNSLVRHHPRSWLGESPRCPYVCCCVEAFLSMHFKDSYLLKSAPRLLHANSDIYNPALGSIDIHNGTGFVEIFFFGEALDFG